MGLYRANSGNQSSQTSLSSVNHQIYIPSWIKVYFMPFYIWLLHIFVARISQTYFNHNINSSMFLRGVAIFWLNKYPRLMKKSSVWTYTYICKHSKSDWPRVSHYDRKTELDTINYIITGWEFLTIKETKLDTINLLSHFYYNHFTSVHSYN